MAHIVNPPDIDFLHPQPFRPQGTAGLILDAAATAVAHGQPIVIREICRQLSLTPGAPYSHFDSSSHLESVVVYNGLLSMAEFLATTTPPTGDPWERLTSASRGYRTWALSHPALFGFVLPTAGRTDNSPFSAHVINASRAIAVPSTRALRDGWDSGWFSRPQPGPPAHPLDIPGVVSLNSDESRIANSLWAMVHGAVVLELAMGTHDGWEPVDPMFDWMIETFISSLLDHPNGTALGL